MKHLSLAALATVLCILLGSCKTAEPLTQVIIVVDSDLIVPGDIDRLRLYLGLPSDRNRQLVNGILAPTAEGTTFPQTVNLLHEDGPLGPIQVQVDALNGDDRVLTQTLRFSFQLDQTLLLPVDLLNSCVGLLCGPSETCRNGECTSIDVPPEELLPGSSLPAPMGTRPSPR